MGPPVRMPAAGMIEAREARKLLEVSQARASSKRDPIFQELLASPRLVATVMASDEEMTVLRATQSNREAAKRSGSGTVRRTSARLDSSGGLRVKQIQCQC